MNGHTSSERSDASGALSRYDPDSTGTSIAPQGVPVQLKLEKTPREFTHLLAAVERQVSALLEPATSLDGFASPSSQYVLGVTSAIPGEGKTTAAMHLALALARDTFKKICLIDLSLGSGDLITRLGINTKVEGFVAALESDDRIVPTLQFADCENLVVIPAGKAPENPSRLARSPRIGQMIASARENFDLVILDLPDVGSDNVLPIAQYADGLLMVTRAGATPAHVVNRALDAIGREKVIGVTLNRTTTSVPAWLQRFVPRS